jgi:hypothetical protein
MHRLLPAAISLAALAAAPARAEVMAQSDAGFVLRIEGQAQAAPEAAWKTLIAPATWWSPAHTYTGDAANLYLDAQATGCFCELLAKPASETTRRGSVEHAHVIYADPGKVLRLSGALGPLQSEALSATLTVSLKPHEGGTKIVWEYVVGGYMRMKTEEIAPLVDQVLAEQAARLAAKAGEGAAPAQGL